MNTDKTTSLREKMREDLRLRNYAQTTRKTYLLHVGYFAKFIGKSPAQCGEKEIRTYLHHLREERKVAISYFKQAVGALRFFYKYTLNQEWLKDRIPYPRQSKTLPQVLTADEVIKLFAAVESIKHRTVLQILYGAGLRLMEGVSLNVGDINSKDMLLRVRCGKGARERMAMLSPELLLLLREYYKIYHPKDWLFPGERGKFHI